MDLGANFHAKLEPFLLMAKSAKGAAAAKLVQDATAAPGVYVFSELLEQPSIQELGKSEQSEPYLSLLQLFAYKTYQDYVRRYQYDSNVCDIYVDLAGEYKDRLPQLNKAQITKLKHLSIVSLAAGCRILPYSDLIKALDMPTIRELEDLIIDAIYLDVLRGKLDQNKKQLEVEYTMGRDLEPGKLESILVALKNWTSTTSTVLATLDDKIDSIAAQAAARKASKDEYDKALHAVIKEVSDRQKDKGPHRKLTGDRDLMEVDDASEQFKSKNRKASQDPVPKQQRKRNRF